MRENAKDTILELSIIQFVEANKSYIFFTLLFVMHIMKGAIREFIG